MLLTDYSAASSSREWGNLSPIQGPVLEAGDFSAAPENLLAQINCRYIRDWTAASSATIPSACPLHPLVGSRWRQAVTGALSWQTRPQNPLARTRLVGAARESPIRLPRPPH